MLCRVRQFKNTLSIANSPFYKSRIRKRYKNDISSIYRFLVSAYESTFERRLCLAHSAERQEQ